jgi:hypothetical protein
MPHNIPPFAPQMQTRPPQVAAFRPPNDDLKNFLQGEFNGLQFYEGLATAPGANEAQRAQIQALLEHRKQSGQQLGNLAANWMPNAPKLAEIEDFRAGLSFALLQESEQLRKALALDAALPSAILHSKTADIACLIACAAL